MTSKSKTLKVIVILVLVGLTIAYVLPVYVMVITSVKSIPEVQAANYLVPSLNPQWQNFSDVLFGSPIFPTDMISRLINSVIITVSVTLLSGFFGGLAGYYLARNRSTFARTVFVLVGIALYLPYQAVIIPLVTIMAKTHLALSYWGMILSYLVLYIPLASVLLGTFFLSVPRAGRSRRMRWGFAVQIFFWIIVPVSLPAYASMAIIIFTQVWNEFFLALSLSSPQTQTVQVVMASAQGTTLVLYNLQMAAALITVAVPLLFFLLLGRYFVRGILAGALKG